MISSVIVTPCPSNILVASLWSALVLTNLRQWTRCVCMLQIAINVIHAQKNVDLWCKLNTIDQTPRILCTTINVYEFGLALYTVVIIYVDNVDHRVENLVQIERLVPAVSLLSAWTRSGLWDFWAPLAKHWSVSLTGLRSNMRINRHSQ